MSALWTAVERFLGTEQPAASGSRPIPDLAEAPYARPFWEAAAEERLLVQYCPACDRHQYFPRPWCAGCAGAVEWTEASGRGTVHSHTVVRRVVSNPGVAEEVPYATAYVELDEGPRMMTRLVECDVDAVERGLPVEVCFDHVTDEVTLPVFRPR